MAANQIRSALKALWWAALLLTLWQATSPTPVEASKLVNDKLGHFGIFLLLGVWGFHCWQAPQQRRIMVVFLVIFGIMIEGIQHYVPNRFFSLADWLADIIGVFASIGLYRWMVNKNRINQPFPDRKPPRIER